MTNASQPGATMRTVHELAALLNATPVARFDDYGDLVDQMPEVDEAKTEYSWPEQVILLDGSHLWPTRDMVQDPTTRTYTGGWRAIAAENVDTEVLATVTCPATYESPRGTVHCIYHFAHDIHAERRDLPSTDIVRHGEDLWAEFDPSGPRR